LIKIFEVSSFYLFILYLIKLNIIRKATYVLELFVKIHFLKLLSLILFTI